MTVGTALYLRVSTADQDLEGQERILREYARTRGWDVSCVFAEKIPASGKVERAAWDALRKEACLPSTRRFYRVLVWALDRWSREPSFVRAIGSIEDLEVLGIQFHSFKEPALDSGEGDSSSLARDLLRGILPTIAAFESRRRSDRTRLAMQEIKEGRRATRSGRPPGRPRLITPDLLAKVKTLREQGLGWVDVAQRVSRKAETLRRAIQAERKARPPAQNPRLGERVRDPRRGPG